jgi:glycosyltransferase involved in cell wall biosynthesis
MPLREDFHNLEDHEGFEVHWHEADPNLGTFTAVLRVKNEARSLPWVLPGLLRVSDRLILIDNGSDDGTPDVARQVAETEGATDRYEGLEYPFSVARCGPEHLSVPSESIHSLTYFYNWAFSHVQTRYCLKWDGDMVLTKDGENYMQQLRWQLEGVDAIIQIPRYAVYVESDKIAYLDAGLTNREPWAWPNKPAFHFGKAFEWEIPVWPPSLPFIRLPEWTCFELKWLDADEFAHWSTQENFKGSDRTSRKAREWSVFHAVQGGDMPEGVHKIESPDDRHVVDYLREPEHVELVLPPPEAVAPQAAAAVTEGAVAEKAAV